MQRRVINGILWVELLETDTTRSRYIIDNHAHATAGLIGYAVFCLIFFTFVSGNVLRCYVLKGPGSEEGCCSGADVRHGAS